MHLIWCLIVASSNCPCRFSGIRKGQVQRVHCVRQHLQRCSKLESLFSPTSQAIGSHISDCLIVDRRTMTMRSFIVLAALLGAAAFVGASEDPTVSLPGVHDLTPDTFSKFVNGGKHVLVEFYAPWCGHCKHLTPEYKKLGEMIQSDPALKSRVVIAKVDADAHRSIGEKFGVKGFPTIKWFARGTPATQEGAVDYTGPRTASGFMEYIKKALDADKSFARVEALDVIAKKFAGADDKAAVIAEAKAAAEAADADVKANAELYVKLMEKAVEKGADYISKEKARLEKMLGSGSLSTTKLDDMSKKASILGAFLEE